MVNHVVRVRLRTRGHSQRGINSLGYEFGSSDFLESRFKYANRIYNEMVSWINEQEEARVNSDSYKAVAQVMRVKSALEEKLKEDGLPKERIKEIKSVLKAIEKKSKDWWIEVNTEFGLNFGKFVYPSKNYGRVSELYQQHLSEKRYLSEVGTAAIANAVSGYLKRKSNGTGDRKLRFKKFRDLRSIEYRKTGFKLLPTGLVLNKDRKSKVYFPFEFRSSDEQRLLYAMEREKLALLNISRTERKGGGYVYHANLVFSGVPYNIRTAGKENVQVGLDFGVSKVVAYAADGTMKTFELSVGTEYAEKLSQLQRELEWKRRWNNPQNYNEDGTIKQGRLVWNDSKAYIRKRAEFKDLNRKITEIRKHKLLSIVREIMEMGDSFYVESLDYAKMQKKKELQQKEDGSGYKSRANYGSQLLYASPAMLRDLLTQKLAYQGIELNKVSTYDSKLSQINHESGIYKKHDLSEKFRNVRGIKVNRRLYTAYLLSFFNGDYTFSNAPEGSFELMLEANKLIKDF